MGRNDIDTDITSSLKELDNVSRSQFDNPFYHNPLFSVEDLKRGKLTLTDRVRLMFTPMKVQLTGDGIAYFKVKNGAYYFYRLELRESDHIQRHSRTEGDQDE